MIKTILDYLWYLIQIIIPRSLLVFAGIIAVLGIISLAMCLSPSSAGFFANFKALLFGLSGLCFLCKKYSFAIESFTLGMAVDNISVEVLRFLGL